MYAKEELSRKIRVLMQQGKQLVETKRKQSEETSRLCMALRWCAKSQTNRDQHQFEINCMIAEREFQRLDKISAFSQKVEPCLYALKLVAGLIMFVISVILIVHTFCYVALKVDGKEVEPFLNFALELIEEGPVGFMATVILVLIGLYFLLAACRGNVKLGLRFFFVSFYPIVPKETFNNAFMANCLVMNLWMSALV